VAINGMHPADKPGHEISLTCDDLDGTIADLRARGVTLRETLPLPGRPVRCGRGGPALPSPAGITPLPSPGPPAPEQVPEPAA
jgi:hypothetical protein